MIPLVAGQGNTFKKKLLLLKTGTLLQIIAYSPRSKLGTLLPDFPDIKDIKLPPNVAEDKVNAFVIILCYFGCYS